MLRLLPTHHWSRLALSLIVLTANIGAPFRSSALGRIVLNRTGTQTHAGPVVRVRSVSPLGSARGFRSVVGLGDGGGDETYPRPTPSPFPALLPPPTDAHLCIHGDRVMGRQNPPLRC